jgi:tetratricopeptide (TPR) repeat protein
MVAAAPFLPKDSLAPMPELTGEWLEMACLGGHVPPEVQADLDVAAANYADDALAEKHLLRAYALAPEHPAVHIGLYRFYFYKNRLKEALGVGERCLAKAARDNGLATDWRQVKVEHAEFSGYDVLPRFYLFTLKGCAYLNLRLGNMAEGEALLSKLIELDPADRLGGSVLRGVLDRWEDGDEF